MRRLGIVALIGVSAFVVPIATPAPAHADTAAACIPLFRRCPSPTPTTTPPAPPPVTTPPVTTPPAPVPAPPAPAPSIDPNVAAEQFFDLLNGARAGVGLPPLGWRADVASMGVSQSVAMAQQGTIFHGSFVSSPNLKALNASSLGENVGMGQAVGQIHDAFMNSPHHRDNILDGGFNQVGIGVIVVDGGMFVTEDFLQAKGGPVSARPTPVAHPVVKAPPKAKAPSNKVASAPKKVATAAAAPTTPTTAAPTTTAPPAEGTVTAVEFAPAPAAAAPTPIADEAAAHSSTALAALFGGLLLLSAAGGHVVIRRRRS